MAASGNGAGTTSSSRAVQAASLSFGSWCVAHSLSVVAAVLLAELAVQVGLRLVGEGPPAIDPLGSSLAVMVLVAVTGWVVHRAVLALDARHGDPTTDDIGLVRVVSARTTALIAAGLWLVARLAAAVLSANFEVEPGGVAWAILVVGGGLAALVLIGSAVTVLGTVSAADPGLATRGGTYLVMVVAAAAAIALGSTVVEASYQSGREAIGLDLVEIDGLGRSAWLSGLIALVGALGLGIRAASTSDMPAFVQVPLAAGVGACLIGGGWYVARVMSHLVAAHTSFDPGLGFHAVFWAFIGFFVLWVFARDL